MLYSNHPPKPLAVYVLALWISFFATLPSFAADSCGSYFSVYADFREELTPRPGFFATIRNLLGITQLHRRSEARKRSLEVIERMNSEPLPKPPAGRKASLSTEDIQTLYDDVRSHPVANFGRLRHYDPEGNIGFCFGRAMTAHLEALWKHKLDQGSIRKIWAVGRMNNWQYHVATAVRGEDGHWYAIDPIFPAPMRIERWHSQMRGNLNILSDFLLFSSKPQRFYPNGRNYSYEGGPTNNYDRYMSDVLDVYKREFRRRGRSPR